jgi:hypothetical protein
MREKPGMLMRRAKASLIPVSGHDDEMLSEIPEGELVEVSVRRKRSWPQLKLYWALLNSVVKNYPCGYPTADKLHSACKMTLGYTSELIGIDGTIYTIPDSVAFSRMTQADFKLYFDNVVILLNRLTGTDVLGKEAA